MLTIILCTDCKCSLYLRIYINRNNNTTYVRSDHCNNVYLIISYKIKCAHSLCIQFSSHSLQCNLVFLLLVQFNSHPIQVKKNSQRFKTIQNIYGAMMQKNCNSLQEVKTRKQYLLDMDHNQIAMIHKTK